MGDTLELGNAKAGGPAMLFGAVIWAITDCNPGSTEMPLSACFPIVISIPPVSVGKTVNDVENSIFVIQTGQAHVFFATKESAGYTAAALPVKIPDKVASSMLDGAAMGRGKTQTPAGMSIDVNFEIQPAMPFCASRA